MAIVISDLQYPIGLIRTQYWHILHGLHSFGGLLSFENAEWK